MSTYVLILNIATALVLSLGLLTAIAWRRTFVIFLAGLLALHLAAWSKGEDLVLEFSPLTIERGQLLIFIGSAVLVVCLWLVEPLLRLAITPEQLARATDFHVSAHRQRRFLVSIVLIAAVAVLIIMRDGPEVFYRGWELQREYSGFLDNFAVFLGFIIAPSIWISIRWRHRLLAMVVLATSLLLMITQGPRAMLITGAVLVLLDIVWLRKTLRTRLVLLLLAGIAALSLHTGLRIARAAGIENIIAWYQGEIYLERLLEQQDVTGGEYEIYRYFYYVIQVNRIESPYREGVTFKRLAMMYLPRSVVPDLKPIDMTSILWRDSLYDGYQTDDPALAKALQNMDADGIEGSVHATTWGDAYANLGPWGIPIYAMLIALVFALIETLLMRVAAPVSLVLFAIASGGYLMIARGNVVIGSGYFAYIIPMALTLFLLTGILFEKIKHRIAANPVAR